MRPWRALTAASVAAVFVLGACSGTGTVVSTPSSSEPSSTAPGPTTPSASASVKTPDVVPVADPEHAVDPPGRRTGPLSYADILVTNPDTLDPKVMAQIRRLDGVVSAASLAVAQVPIENKVFTLAAVDATTYRNFTPSVSADAQKVWVRVAGGELALRPKLGAKAPLDPEGYLRLGSDKDAPRIHVGAYAPQVRQIDGVLNETWVPTLEMTPENALVISTGGTAPQSVRGPIQRLIGDRGSVQMLDAVTRYGIDADVVQTAVVVGTVAQAVGTFNYTVLGGGRIAPERSWVNEHIATRTVPILGSVTCNTLIFPQLEAALTEVQAQGLASTIHPGEFAGCYYPRFIAGTTSLSNHSFGLALDLNVPGNQRGTVGEMDRGVVAIFKRWGFAWGGDWSYTDPMHFEMNQLVDPR